MTGNEGTGRGREREAGTDDGATRGEAGGDGWPVLDSSVEFECPWFSVGYDRVRRPNGDEADYYWVDARDAVGVVPVTDDGDVVLVEEYRPNQGGPVVSLPAGGREDGESFPEAARRELREETGYVADECEFLTSFVPTTRIKQPFGVVVATGLAAGEQDLDDGEFIDVHTASFAEAVAAMETGPTLGWSLLALYLAGDRGHV
jgi:ADP-ribose pyrophosphatase